MGVSLGADIATLGASSLVKGGIEVAVKEGTELLTKDVTEQVLKEGVEEGGKSAAKNGTEEGYNGFKDFKKANGSAGKGNAWHHVVEQNPSNVEKFGPKAVHNESNIVNIPHGKGSLHAKVTGHYNSKVPGTNMRVRDMVNKMSYEKQREYGIKTLKKFGWKQ